MHLILYKINKKDNQLYDIISHNIDKFNNPFFYKIKSDDGLEHDVFEGTISDEKITIYFDGNVNFIWLSIKYSQFLNHKSYYERVINFEKKIFKLFSNNLDLYRADEILLDDLAINKGIYWYRDDNANEIFNNWIQNEERLHWFKIELPYNEISFELFLKERQ